ncbi:hypothetical protein PR001_g16539 [Phytophthora rubi]|uniref:Uncharacterized protein n=1 Tax=Phytophthora rubi TaxID=129364 RepID=A0A6A3KZH4_9STRA|nr:hypothetical protein PR002_g17073 [Phytophthora rubi]KAE9009053.1 hypothetical protein PR001_g16539 [Phytophthora rubi]
MVGKPRHDAEATKLTKKSMKSAAKVVTREQHIGGPASSNETGAPQQPSLTPYERMRQLLAQRDPVAGPVVVDTVEGLKLHVQGSECDCKEGIRMKLLMISGHKYKDWKLARPISLMRMRWKVFRDRYESNCQEIDSLLVTATVWNVESDSELLPTPGCVVEISDYTNLQLYGDTQCQLTTRLSQINWEGKAL